ncbi:hypothetical protein GCM10029964_118020 [Kibdelosporangium lantanae]
MLARALALVPSRQRAAVVLRYWSQLSVVETAKVLRCSEGNVKSRTARGPGLPSTGVVVHWDGRQWTDLGTTFTGR